MDGLSPRKTGLVRWFVALLLLFSGCAGYPASIDREQLTAEQLSALESDSYTYEWITTDQPSAVAVLVHGLNLLPDAMDDIAEALSLSGIDVLSVSLSGHADELDEQGRLVQFGEADFSVWQNDVRNAVLEASAYAADAGVPLYMVGFSLGGLLSADYQLHFSANDAVAIDRMVLFAPAISLRWSSYLLYPLQAFPEVVLPSAAPDGYRANDFAPVSAYLALYEGIGRFNDSVDASLNIPVLLFMHPRDELVSDNRIRDFIDRHDLTRWQYVSVDKSEGAANVLNHLIIGPDSLGVAAWLKVREQMLSFLEGDGGGL
jgi:dienelactone hydrolase